MKLGRLGTGRPLDVKPVIVESLFNLSRVSYPPPSFIPNSPQPPTLTRFSQGKLTRGFRVTLFELPLRPTTVGRSAPSESQFARTKSLRRSAWLSRSGACGLPPAPSAAAAPQVPRTLVCLSSMGDRASLACHRRGPLTHALPSVRNVRHPPLRLDGSHPFLPTHVGSWVTDLDRNAE